MTVVDHPLRHAAELNRRIAEDFASRPCWKASLVLGSMFVLDFGGRRSLIGRGGKVVVVGEATLSIRNVLWFVELDGKIVQTSDGIGPEAFAALEVLFVGRTLQKVEWDTYVSFMFSGGAVFRCDRTDAYENEDEDIAEFRFVNDDYVDCYASGEIKTESASP